MLAPYFSLEKIKRPEDQNYIIYTYVFPEESVEGKTKGYFIPLVVCKTLEKAEKRAKEIIHVTKFNNVLVAPMAKWLSLGNPDDEKVKLVDIEKGLKDIANEENKKNERLRQERKEIEEEIREEQKCIQDPESIESLYYEWYSLVTCQAVIESTKKQLENLLGEYDKHVDKIKQKETTHPEYVEKWPQLLLERLVKRGEEKQAKKVIEDAKKLRTW